MTELTSYVGVEVHLDLGQYADTYGYVNRLPDDLSSAIYRADVPLVLHFGAAQIGPRLMDHLQTMLSDRYEPVRITGQDGADLMYAAAHLTAGIKARHQSRARDEWISSSRQACRIRPDDIVAVLQALPMLDVVGKRIDLHRGGDEGQWIGMCPFHQDTEPRFTVDPAFLHFSCLGCSRSGDTITFLMEIDHLEYAEAVRRLADRAGITVHEDPPVRTGTAR